MLSSFPGGLLDNLEPNDPGIHPDARGKAAASLALLEIATWCSHRVLAMFTWLTSSRRRLMVAGAIVTVGALTCAVMLRAPQSTPLATIAPISGPAQIAYFTYTVQSGDNPGAIANRYSTTVEQIVLDNLDLFEKHTAWCTARRIDGKPISQAYLSGLTLEGKKRAGEFCVLTTIGGQQLALGTLKPNDLLRIRCANASVPLPAACSQSAVATK